MRNNLLLAGGGCLVGGLLLSCLGMAGLTSFMFSLQPRDKQRSAERKRLDDRPLTQAEREPNDPEPKPTDDNLVVKDAAPRVAVEFYVNSRSKDRFGISLPKLAAPDDPTHRKRLFFDPNGRGNNTITDLNGYRFIFGERYASAHYETDPTTKATLHDARLPDLPRPIKGWISKMNYRADDASITVAQEIKIVPGETTRLLDTVLVTYTVVNTGNQDAIVALRTMLDAFLGGNDGVPFLVPPTAGRPQHFVGREPSRKNFTAAATIVLQNQPLAAASGAYYFSTGLNVEILAGEQVPDFVQAFESGDLTDPANVNAVLRLRIDGCQDPEKFVICRYPGEVAGGGQAAWGGGDAAKGDWAFKAMNDPPDAKKDSCVVIYWAQQNLPPKEKRVFGYAYGLGRMAGEADPDTKIAVNGNKQLGLQFIHARPGQSFPVIAYVRGDKDQKVALTLPAGVELVEGETAERTVDATANRAAVVWQVKAAKKGVYRFEAFAPGIGAAQSTVEVRDPLRLENRGRPDLPL